MADDFADAATDVPEVEVEDPKKVALRRLVADLPRRNEDDSEHIDKIVAAVEDL